MRTPVEALEALIRSWPMIVEECRCVLAAELHYQAVVYHCLREVGGVPPGQIGMNVKNQTSSKCWTSERPLFFKEASSRSPMS